ncbi:MAG: hypothetical protein ACI89L_000599 [Phycisphaerales bacterium]|jgi:hypothetical protein
MPRYDYHCPANSQTLEVAHAMSHTVKTWGELCELAEIETGDTDSRSPVEKTLSLSFVGGNRRQATPMPGEGSGSCGSGCGCHPG